MTAIAVPRRLPDDATLPLATGAWGMALLIATEAALFAYLFFSYFYLRTTAHGAWAASTPPDLKLATLNTGLLLLSSLSMWWGGEGIRQGNQSRLRLGLLLTFALGAAFLVVQVAEYRQLPFTPQTDAHGSLFYLITGLHGAHVAVGLLMIIVIFSWALFHRFSAERHLAVINVSRYWHFVDAIWLLVFTTLYLSPRFLH